MAFTLPTRELYAPVTDPTARLRFSQIMRYVDKDLCHILVDMTFHNSIDEEEKVDTEVRESVGSFRSAT